MGYPSSENSVYQLEHVFLTDSIFLTSYCIFSVDAAVIKYLPLVSYRVFFN